MMLQKQDYINGVQKQLENWKNEVQNLRNQVDSTDGESRDKFYQVIDEIVDRKHLVENKLNEFKITGDEALGHWETEIDNLRHQVQNAFHHAREIIN